MNGVSEEEECLMGGREGEREKERERGEKKKKKKVAIQRITAKYLKKQKKIITNKY